jgi:hypothetical protein
MAKTNASNTFIEIYEPPNFVNVPVAADVPVAIVLPDAIETAPVVVEITPAVDIPVDIIPPVSEEVPAQAGDLVDTSEDIIVPVIEPPASEGATS